MKKYTYKIAFLLFLIPLLIFANNDKKKHEKSKTIHKNYAVNTDATVEIDNKYGNINITTWNKNRVEIEVKITVKGTDLDAVEDKLNQIDVVFHTTASLVEAKTVFEKVKHSWNWFKRGSNTSFKINYYIKMPETNQVDLENDYGAISLNKLKGKASIKCGYGKISIGELLNEINYIDLEYCSSSSISYINNGKISIDYSKLTIDKSKKIRVNADYSNVNIDETQDIHFNADYGSFRINKANNIKGNGDYTSMRFGTIYNSVEVDTDYGGIKIKDLVNGFDFVDINAEYAGVKIGVAPNCNFNFVIDVSYASFKYDSDKVDMIKSIVKSFRKHYEGVYGTKPSNSTITIKSGYGGVSIREN